MYISKPVKAICAIVYFGKKHTPSNWAVEYASDEIVSKRIADYSPNYRYGMESPKLKETYLRAFLDNPIIPLDNNAAERSIKKFCVGKHSWHIIASKRGARASAILYSIAETSKANGLKPFEYCRLNKFE